MVATVFTVAVSTNVNSGDTGLIAYWSFDEGSGGIAYDSAGSNHGTIYGASWVDGISGHALSFDGVDDYIEVPDSDSLDIANEITIEAWIKKQESSRIESIISKGAYSLKIGSDGKPYLELCTGSETIVDVGQLGTNTLVVSLTVYDGKLYGGTYDSGRVYRYDGGTTWTDVGQLGTNTHVFSLVVYNSKLYGGTDPSGRVYRYDGGTTWTDVGQIAGKEVRSLAVYDGKLYGGTEPSGRVYRYDGGTIWTDVGQLGTNTNVLSLAVYDGKLYGGTYPSGRVYRYDGGTTWADLGQLGTNTCIYSLAVYDSKLYAGTDPSGRVYRYDGGTTWIDIGQLGTNDNVRSLTVYDGKLYGGTYDSGRVYSIGDGLTVYSNNPLNNQFNYITGTYDGSIIKIFINGMVENSKTQSLNINTNSLYLLIGESYGSSQGGFSGSGDDNFNGLIDEARIWNRALSAEEISEIYTMLALPDLSISSGDITFSNPNPLIGETITIDATVRNVGWGGSPTTLIDDFTTYNTDTWTHYGGPHIDIDSTTPDAVYLHGARDRSIPSREQTDFVVSGDFTFEIDMQLTEVSGNGIVVIGFHKENEHVWSYTESWKNYIGIYTYGTSIRVFCYKNSIIENTIQLGSVNLGEWNKLIVKRTGENLITERWDTAKTVLYAGGSDTLSEVVTYSYFSLSKGQDLCNYWSGKWNADNLKLEIPPLDVSATISFYDGNPNEDGIPIDQNSITVHGNEPVTTSIDWMPTTGGLHEIYVRIEEVEPGDNEWNNNIASKSITVFPIEATIDIDPDTINLGGGGNFVTCYIELPEDFDVKEIDANSILLEDTLQPILDPTYGWVTDEDSYIMDHDEDGILERMVKFDRSEGEDMLSPGTYNLKVTGELTDGTSFEGYSDEITVINPP